MDTPTTQELNDEINLKINYYIYSEPPNFLFSYKLYFFNYSFCQFE